MDTEKIANFLYKDEKFWEYCNDSQMIHLLVSGMALCKGSMYPNTRAKDITKAAIKRIYDDLDAKTINGINEEIIEQSLHDDRFNNIEQNIEKFKQSFVKCYNISKEDSSFLATKTKYDLEDWYRDMLDSYIYATDDERKKTYNEWHEKLLDPNKLYDEYKNEIEERINEISVRSTKVAEKLKTLSEEIQKDQHEIAPQSK